MNFIDMFTLSKSAGIRVKYEGNVLYCCAYKTAEENFGAIKKALALLLDMDEEIIFGIPQGGGRSVFEDNGGIVELYRAWG